MWDYPVKPGTEEWRKFQSNQEMVDVCQIPEEVLLPISTDDLMKLCLNYPLLYDVFAFNNTNEGLDKLFSDFNGIRPPDPIYVNQHIKNSSLETKKS